jgi:hypothetical protein
MNTLRISVTELDAWRYYCEEDWMTTEVFLSRLRGEDEENDAMRAGTAFHNFLEHAEECEVDEFESEGIKFSIDCDIQVPLPKVREIKTEKDYRIGHTLVTLVGKADAVDGREVFDHKLSKEFNPDRYMDSYQWRAYLTMFDGWRFTYNVFTGKEKDGTWSVTDFDQLSMYAYDGMEEDVLNAVTELTWFIEKYVPERLNDAEADAKKVQF